MSKFVLRNVNGGSFYNGGLQHWSVEEVDDPKDISSRHVYDTKQEILDMSLYEIMFKYWYDIVELEGILLKPKPISPYGVDSITIPKLSVGCRNELCTICATNILAGEKYVIWKDGKKYCLHCIMMQLNELDSLIGSVPSELKEEWAVHGKAAIIKCMDCILKVEVG